MKYLLDSHIVIWALVDDDRLSEKARRYMTDMNNRFYYSAATVLELDMKMKSKNNNIEFTIKEFVDMCSASGIIPLPLKQEHIIKSNELIWTGAGKEHKDPFDRMLLAHAIVDDLRFITHDEKISMFKQECVVLV